MARLLLETGADVSLNDLLGVSALMYSWINTQFEVCGYVVCVCVCVCVCARARRWRHRNADTRKQPPKTPGTQVLLDWLLPHHLYHVAMHNMLWEHAISTTAAAAMRPAAAPAA